MSNSLNNGLITGSAAVTEQLLFGNLMDMVKIEKQRNMNISYYNITKNYCKKGIFKGMVKGLFPWGILLYGSRGLFYGSSFQYSKNFLEKNTDYSNHNINIISGFTGGLSEGILTSPFVFMRTNIAESVSNGKQNYNYICRQIDL